MGSLVVLKGVNDMKSGKVVSINISEKKGTIKTPIKKGHFRENHGLDGDAHSGNWHRQVSLLAVESIDKMKEKGIQGLDYGKFAENITTQGIVLHELEIGTRLRIGSTIQEVTQIGKLCHKGCDIAQEVGECIMPKEGIFTKVIEAGEIFEGDSIEII